MKSSAESSVIGRTESRPIADIALQQTTSRSRTDLHLCALQQRIKPNGMGFERPQEISMTYCAQLSAPEAHKLPQLGARVQVCPARTA
jgi:hypothetical protein